MTGLVLGLVVVAGLVGTWLTRSPAEGPLAPPPGESVVGFTRVEVGRPFTFGAIFLVNQGATTVFLDSIDLLDPSPGLGLVGKHVVIPGESLQVAARNTFPPREVKLHPFSQFALASRARAQVLLGLVVDAPGTYKARGVKLFYHSKEEHYVVDFLDGVKVDLRG